MHGGKTGWRKFVKFQLILMENVDFFVVWNLSGLQVVI